MNGNRLSLTLTLSFITGILLLSGILTSVKAQPQLANIESQEIKYTAGDKRVKITSTITVSGNLIYRAEIRVSSGYHTGEDLLTYSGRRFSSTWDEKSGILTLSGYGSESDYRTALRDIFYENRNTQNPSTDTRTISFTATSIYGTGNTVSRRIVIIVKNIPPQISNLETTPLIYCYNSGTVGITGSLTLLDGDDINLVSATVSITEGYNANEDKLLFSDRNGIRGKWNANGGVLSLSGNASLLAYQEALRSIQYECSNPQNPQTVSHKITFVVNDGIAQSNPVTRDVSHNVPSAEISGNFAVCSDRVAAIEIELTGTAPWNFSYRLNNGNPQNVRNVTVNPYILSTNKKGTYSLVEVHDNYCPGKVSGSAAVDILPTPDVTITGLEPAYSKESMDIIPLTGIPGGGTFSGPGVVQYGSEWFFFPALPDPGLHNIIYKYRANETSCYGYDTVRVRILEKSAAIEIENNRDKFCNNDLPFKVTGINLLNNEPGTFSITGGRGLVDHGNNKATVYPDSLEINNYIITYTAPDGNPASQEIQIGSPLVADFNWNAECFDPDVPVLFTNTSESPYGFFTADSYRWTIYTETDSANYSSKDVEYSFPEAGNYLVKLRVNNSNGCVNETGKMFPLRPVFVLTGNNYADNFEGEKLWESGHEPNTIMNSWKLGKPDEVINGFSDPYSGENCWFTDIRFNPVPGEHSWITSPCFDFTGTEKPTLVARIRRSFTDNRDGANITYSTDNGRHWNLVGSLNDGINWFNGYYGNPGAQSQGWTAIMDSAWVETRHILDFIKDESLVQFRINFNAYGSAIGNKGLAVDDIKIVERNRTILVEHFTNLSEEAVSADNILDEIAIQSGAGLIDLQYHTNDPGDPFYSGNPVVSNSRQFYYGLNHVPYSIINGGVDASQHIDYANSFPTQRQIGVESLYDSDFDMKITTMPEDNGLYAEVVITALNDVNLSELSLRMAVIEPLIVDASVNGNDSVFRNVVRAMLPDAAGNNIYRSWKKGDIYRVVEYWEIDNASLPEGLRVVAFIQNEMNHEIEQAAIDQRGLINSTDDLPVSTEKLFYVYPIPADILITIDLSRVKASEFSIEIINSLGTSVYSQKVSGDLNHQIPVNDLPAGIYVIRAISDTGDIYSRKIIVHH